MESTRLAPPRTVTGKAEGLVSRGGLVWLAETADLCGLTAGLDDAFAGLPRQLQFDRLRHAFASLTVTEHRIAQAAL